MVRHFRNQKYAKLKRDHQQRGELFTDPEFPPESRSLFLSGTNEHDIVWKRPRELCDNPHLVVNGVSSTDLNQGRLGNCWFVAACSALALEQKLWDKVVPHWREQDWDDVHQERYAGIFHFHFWRLGEWVDVVVDDYLPTKNGELVYMKSKDKNEFWSPLLEKAYAKLAGSYEVLAGGQTGDALVDFTGGVNEPIDLRAGGYSTDEEKKTQLFDRMEKAHERRALTSCSISLSEGDSPETVLDCGLIKGHAYTVTDIKKVPLHSGMSSIFRREKLLMVRLRNPWGLKEWNGPWSDRSEEWSQVPQKEKGKLGLKVEDDGEFWMEFNDWLHWFTDCSICRIINTSVLSLHKTWQESAFHGKWMGRSAGGCINHQDTFLHNPQYTFRIPHDDSEVMFSLYQKDPRRERKGKVDRASGGVGGENFSIGFHIMKVEENRKYRMHIIQQKAASITFTNRRSVFGKFTMNTGRYVVVPSTFDPEQEREFYIRLFTERASHATELKKDIPTRGCFGYLCCCCWSAPQALVTVHLEGAQGLEKQDLTGKGADPYCIVKCERSKATTPVKKDTLDPSFGSRVTFFVRKPDTSSIVVQVWNSNVLVDRFMGQVSVPVPRDGANEHHTMKLMGRGRHSEEQTHGNLTFRVECSHNLRAT